MGEKQEKEKAHDHEELRKRVAELEEKVKKLETVAKNSNIKVAQLQRELEYMRERYRRDLEEQRKFGHEKLALDLLGVLDDFERALLAVSETGDLKSFLEGVKMIHAGLRRILARHHVEEIDIEGKEFDPYLAEAVETVHSKEHPPNTVVKVIQKGYKLHGKVIRPARVVVSVEENEDEHTSL